LKWDVKMMKWGVRDGRMIINDDEKWWNDKNPIQHLLLKLPIPIYI